MVHDSGGSEARETEADALDRVERTRRVSVGLRRQVSRRYREFLLRAAAREILSMPTRSGLPSPDDPIPGALAPARPGHQRGARRLSPLASRSRAPSPVTVSPRATA